MVRRARAFAVAVAFVLVPLVLSVPGRAADRPEPAAGPLFGTIFERFPALGTQQAGLARVDRAYGRTPVVRLYYNWLPPSWSELAAAGVRGRAVSISFRNPEPTDLAAGRYDAFFRTWFAEAPRDQDVWWTFYAHPHEAVDAGEFTPAQFREALRHLDRLADGAGNPRLHTTLVLNDYVLDPARGHDWRAYYPGADVVDTQAWVLDVDEQLSGPQGYRPLATYPWQVRPSATVTRAEGNEYAVSWVGAANPAGRAGLLRDLSGYARGAGARYLFYYDADDGGGIRDYRLTDPASQAAWREAVASSGKPAAGDPGAGSPGSPTAPPTVPDEGTVPGAEPSRHGAAGEPAPGGLSGGARTTYVVLAVLGAVLMVGGAGAATVLWRPPVPAGGRPRSHRAR